jgi:hypothetical protein
MQLNPDTMDRVLREFARDLADARRAEVERLRLILYELELLRDGVTEVVAEARAEVRVSIAELRIAQANNDKIKLLDLPRLPRPHMNFGAIAFGRQQAKPNILFIMGDDIGWMYRPYRGGGRDLHGL